MSKKKPAAIEVLSAFADAIGRLRWYVFGAQAAIAHGRARSTADVDVTIEEPPQGLTRLLAALQRAGFEPADPEFQAIVAESRTLPLRHRSSGMGLDIVFAGPGLEQEFLERARRMDLGGLRVPVISVEDLLITKILAGRPKDLDDARSLLRVHERRADLGRVRKVLANLDDALDRRDLVPAFEAMLSAPRKRVARPRKPGR